MDFFILFIKNIINIPLLCFLIGLFLNLMGFQLNFPKKANQLLTVSILFCIGLKGGIPLLECFSTSPLYFSMILSTLILWGFLQPVLAFYLLKSVTRIDTLTAAAISASFGSVSVITFTTAISFLDVLHIDYQKFIIPTLAIMEIPAIISGVFLAKTFDKTYLAQGSNLKKLLRESLLNKAVIAIFIGMITGVFLYNHQLTPIGNHLLVSFKPLLCLFLLDMGLLVGLQKKYFRAFSSSLNLFGLYMPLIGGCFGLLLSYLFHLDIGTSTLMAVLTASASYIAVPAAMKIVLPQAKEAVYLPLSLGIAFPFNVIIGIPLYYYFASRFLT